MIDSGLVTGLFFGDKLIGKIGFTDEGEGHFWLRGMVVAKEHQGKHLGRLLVETAIGTLKKDHKLKKLSLSVHPENTPALILYLKLGFEIKEWISDKYGPGIHRLRMEKKTIS